VSGCCPTLTGEFDADYVARELASREKGAAGPTSARLVDLLVSASADGAGLAGASLLDVGAGFGDIHTALFERGLGTATHVEASEVYSRAARDLAREGGWEDRVRFEIGDFIDLSGALADADIVTLDRVVCCYPDMPALLDRSAARARRLYALSAPRDGWFVRFVIGVKNGVRRLRKDPFRTFVHSWTAMDSRLRALGLEPVGESGTLIWRVVVYRRANPRSV